MPNALKQKRKAGVDTSVLVPMLCQWHAFHKLATDALASQLSRGTLILSSHALLETYSVLTRLPAPYRISPIDAIQLLESNASLFAEETSATSTDVWALLRNLGKSSVGGGRTYDILIFQSTVRAGATAFITFNARDLAGFEGSVQIIVP